MQVEGKTCWIGRLLDGICSERLNCHSAQQPSIEEPRVEWDHDDYLSVEPEFEAMLKSTESHDLIPALSVAEILTCEQAKLYSPEAVHQQLLDSSNTAVHVSELKMIIDNARETVRLKRVNAWNPFVRMAAPAEVEGAR